MPRAMPQVSIQITGSDGPDTLFGTSLNDTISSGLGDDFIYGNNGDDVIDADTTMLPPLAQANNDVVFGGKGDDVIRVGSGQDIVDGGPGDDTIVLAAGGMLV